jgi:hypothetical protein
MQTILHQLPDEAAYTRQLEAALAPFAAVGCALADECHDPERPVWLFVVGMRGEIKSFVVGDFLRAARLGGGG